MDIFKTVTFRQSTITTTGTVLNGLLGAVFYVLLARFLGPSDFGLITVSIATLTMVADIVDFGTNTGIVRHVSANINFQREKALRFLKLAIEFKLIIWILVLVIGFFLSPFIAEKIFNKTELTGLLKLVMVGVGGALLFSFATSALQAFQKYFIWSFVNIATNSLRLFLVLILFFNSNINLYSGLVSYIVMPFFGFSMALLFLPISRIIAVKDEGCEAREFFHYNFWVAAFTVIAAVSARLDTFISARLLSSTEVGIYGAAVQLAQVVPQIVGALGVVAAPKFASFQYRDQMITYFKKFQVLVLGLAALGSLAIPASLYVIPLIYGQSYQASILPFIILFFGMLIFLISLPLHSSIIYYFSKPQVFVWVSIGHLLIVTIAGFILISNYGVAGAATTVAIGMLFNFLVPLAWFINKLRKKK